MKKRSKYLIPKLFIKELLATASWEISKLEVTVWTLLHSFFHITRTEKSFPEISFNDITDIDYLKLLKKKIKKKRQKESHIYKKLHYTYILSEIHKRLSTLKTKKCIGQLDLLEWIAHQGDILLVSYEAHGSYWNRMFNATVSHMLQLFSHSVFSHVGIVGLHSDNGYDRVHSTLDNSGWRSWVKQEHLQTYLTQRMPSTVMLIRPQWISSSQKFSFLERAYEHVRNQVAYDTWDAVADLVWVDLWRDASKFNCWELVYDCIHAVSDEFSIEWRWIPSAYVKNTFLDPVYIWEIL